MTDRSYTTNSPFAETFVETGQGRIIADLLFNAVNTVAESYGGYRRRRREARLRRETLKVVSELSPALQRDIGWPERFEKQMKRSER